MANTIRDYPELALAEHHACRPRADGFTVTIAISDLPTAVMTAPRDNPERP